MMQNVFENQLNKKGQPLNDIKSKHKSLILKWLQLQIKRSTNSF